MTQRLIGCMFRNKSLAQSDRDMVRATSETYIKNGLDESAAEINAIVDILANAELERNTIIEAIKAQHLGAVSEASGARKASRDGLSRTKAARDMFKSAINNPDLVGKQRADTIEGMKNLVAFHEAHAAQSDADFFADTEYRNGDRIKYTGVVDGDKREFVWLEGAKAGQYGASIVPDVMAAQQARQRRAEEEQQAGFDRLGRNAKVGAGGANPLAGATPDAGESSAMTPGQSSSPSVADQQTEGKIEDFGEKLGGAKKGKAAELHEIVRRELSDEEIASQPLSKIWPKESIDQIEDPFIASVAHSARAEIPAKPRQSYKVRAWVEKVKTLRGMTATMLRGGIGRDFMSKYVKEHRGLEHFYTKVQLLESIDRQNWDRIGYAQEWPDSYTYAEDGKTQIPTPLVLVEIDGKRQRYDASSVADVLDKVRDALGEAPKAKKMEFEVRGQTGRYTINKKGDKLYRKLKTFDTSKEAFEYRASNYDDLVAAWEAVKDSDNVKETDVRRAENRPRTAQDWRGDLAKARVIQSLIERSNADANLIGDLLVRHSGASKFSSSIDVPRPFGTANWPDSSDSVNANLRKRFSYMTVVGLNLLRNLAETPSISVQLRGEDNIPLISAVQEAMVTLGHDKKVLGSVVERIPVDVMNFLAGKEIAPERLFSDKSVFKSLLSVNGGMPVGSSGNDPIVTLMRQIAGGGAEVIGANDPARIALENDTALVTGQFDSGIEKSLFSHDVSPEEFKDTFSHKGVEFGNWVAQGKSGKERQGMLNRAYDALMDLASIIGVPPKAMSLNGSLGLGFGSRGSGKFAAHFEPDMLVINLTKTRGAGSLAHEWFHALDNYFQSMRGKGYDYITNNPENYYVHKQSGQKLPARAFSKMIDGERDATYGTIAQRFRDRSQWELKEGVRPEVGEAFADLVNALNDSPMSKRASLIDKGKSNGYWSRIIERAARSFENYVIHKMMLKGYHNDYLANVTAIEEFQRDPGRYPYLLEGEIQTVADAFDNLFSVVETKQTDSGVAMFSRGSTKAEQINAGDLNKVASAIREAFPGIKINVVEDDSQAPESLLQEIANAGAAGDVAGAFHDGEVYLLRSGIRDAKHAEETAIHEAEHAGLFGMFGNSVASVMLDINRSNLSVRAKAYALVKKYDYSVARATEEVLADMGKDAANLRGWDKLVAWVRDMLRSVGIVKEWSDADVSDLVTRALGHARKPGWEPGSGEHSATLLSRRTGRNAWLESQIASSPTMRRVAQEKIAQLAEDRRAALEQQAAGKSKFAANKAKLELARNDYSNLIESAHRLRKINFKPLPLAAFNARDTLLIHRSPSYGKTAGSSYRLVLVDGEPAYARESNHWGQFFTNDWINGEQVSSSFDWPLEGVEQTSWGDKQRHAGYVLLRELEGAPTPSVDPDSIGSRSLGTSRNEMQERPAVRADESGSLAEPAQSGGGAGSGTMLSAKVDAGKTAMRDFLLGNPVVSIKRGVIAAKEGEKPTEAAYRWLAEHPQLPFERPDVGEIVFDRNGLENSLQHKFGWQKLNAVAAIPDVLHKGIVIEKSPDAAGKPLVHTLIAAPIDLEGERYQMVIRLHQDPRGNNPHRFYVHEVVLERDVAAPIKTGAEPTEGFGRTGGRDHIRSVLRDILTFKDDAPRLSRAVSPSSKFSRASQHQIRGATTETNNVAPPIPNNAQASIDATGGEIGNPSWTIADNSPWVDFVRKYQNKHVDLKATIEAISNASGVIRDKFDPYLQEELFHKRTAKRTTDFFDNEFKPLLVQMRMNRVTRQEFEEYLHARHAKEANKLIRDRGGMADGGSGMTDAQADAYFAALSPEAKHRFESLAKRVDAMIAGTRDVIVAYGLESKETVGEWAKMFEHYVPLHREDMEEGMGIGQGFSVRGPASKHRTGSSRQVADILANIAQARDRAIVRGEKNRVAVALYGLAYLNPNPEIWEVDKAPAKQTLDKNGQIVKSVDPNYKSKPNVIVARIKGKDGRVHDRAVVFNSHDERALKMSEAMKNLNAPSLEGIIGVSAKITRYMASMSTQYNPVFMFVNFARDFQAANLNLSSTPLAGKQAEVSWHAISALPGIFSDLRAHRAGKAPSSKWAQLYEQMQLDGGTTGYRDMFATANERTVEQIDKLLDPEWWAKTGWGKAISAGGILKAPEQWLVSEPGAALMNWLSDMNETAENAMRLAVYKTALDHGISRDRAASLAKNITVNFNRKGQIGAQANALYAFFNASVQGTARLAETIKGPAGRQIILGGITLGVMQALALAAAGLGDDDPPDFVRERSLIIPFGLYDRVMGKSAKDARKDYITIPMPLGFHVLPNLGRIPAEFVMGGFKNPGKHATRLIGLFFEAFNPIGSAGVSLQTIMPTPLDPFVALAENKDWTGKKIFREDYSQSNPTPGHLRAKDTASMFSRWLSEAINTISGGDRDMPGELSPTPDQIDYLIGQATGGVGREILKAWQLGESAVTGEEMPTHKIPLVGRLYGNAEGQAHEASKFYDNLKDINVAHAGAKGRMRRGEDVKALLADHPEAGMYKAAQKAEREIGFLRRQKRKLIDAGASKEQIKRQEDRITAAMARLNRSYEAIESGR